MNFNHFTPTQVVFGRGRLVELGTCAAPLGRRALVVCGRTFVRASGLLARVQAVIASADMSVHVFDGISANPRSDEVDAAAAVARERRCDVVVGVGGGSALDAAKAVAVSVHRETVRELIGATLPPDAAALPIIAVPTTAGTGSEVTKGAIIKDVVRGFKSGVRGDGLFPRVALIDPDLSEGMPDGILRATAFDALTHAIESYVGRGATPLTDALAEQVMQIFAMHASSLIQGRRDAAAHEAMCLAALLGGINVANASTCLPHRLQQAMGAVDRIDVSHAHGLAAVYPSWLKRARPFAPAKFGRVACLLNLPPDDLPAGMADLQQALGLPVGLGALGYTPADIDTLVRGISGNLGNDPITPVDQDLLRAIYADALQG